MKPTLNLAQVQNICSNSKGILYIVVTVYGLFSALCSNYTILSRELEICGILMKNPPKRRIKLTLLSHQTLHSTLFDGLYTYKSGGVVVFDGFSVTERLKDGVSLEELQLQVSHVNLSPCLGVQGHGTLPSHHLLLKYYTDYA